MWRSGVCQDEETSLQVCAAVRQLPRSKLVVRDNTPTLPVPPVVVAGEAQA